MLFRTLKTKFDLMGSPCKLRKIKHVFLVYRHIKNINRFKLPSLDNITSGYASSIFGLCIRRSIDGLEK